MKRFFSCCLLLILMAFTALTLVGCMGFDTEDFDKLFERYQNGEITLEEFEDKMKEQMVLPLHGRSVNFG